MYVIKNMGVLERMPWAAKDSVFHKLAQIAEVRNLTKEERLRYDQSLKHYRDTFSVMQGAINEGREEGLKEGREEGERKKNCENAKKMKELGLPIDTIQKVTGLTDEEINKL